MIFDSSAWLQKDTSVPASPYYQLVSGSSLDGGSRKCGNRCNARTSFPIFSLLVSELIFVSTLFLSPESSNLVTKIGLGEGEDAFPLQHRQRRHPRLRRRRSKTDNNGSSLAASSEDAVDDYSDSKFSVGLKRVSECTASTARMRVSHVLVALGTKVFLCSLQPSTDQSWSLPNCHVRTMALWCMHEV